jgi:hypothetical protein
MGKFSGKFIENGFFQSLDFQKGINFYEFLFDFPGIPIRIKKQRKFIIARNRQPNN